MNTRCYLCLLLLFASNLAYSQSPEVIAKQLAGPPSEFSILQPAQPIDSATHSKSALIPIQLSRKTNDLWSWSTKLPVAGENLQLLVFSGNSNDWNISMRAPSGLRSESLDTLAVSSYKTNFGIAQANHPVDFHEFENLTTGQWTFTIEALKPRQKQGFLLIGSETPQRIMSYQTSKQQLLGDYIGFATYAYTQDNATTLITNASLRVTEPDGKTINEHAMYDDGLHNDGDAGDGVFGAEFLATHIGNYNAQVVVTGRDANNTVFIRTTEHLLAVIESDVSFASNRAYASEVSSNRLMINLPISTSNPSAKHHVLAEVWGRSKHNHKQSIPIAWIGGMVTGNNGNLSVGLDTRWIAKAEANGPFELRNVRIEDPDHFIPIATMQSMALNAPPLPESASRAFTGSINQEMLMGIAPLNTNRGSGSKLLLVHGYCSGNVWGPVANQFSNAALFMDLNQNRSHDQFALRIHAFGSSYNSYGIVAHSQGGAAATHLYTYYWSGLDNATGGRLIQSVGTPYQGIG